MRAWSQLAFGSNVPKTSSYAVSAPGPPEHGDHESQHFLATSSSGATQPPDQRRRCFPELPRPSPALRAGGRRALTHTRSPAHCRCGPPSARSPRGDHDESRRAEQSLSVQVPRENAGQVPLRLVRFAIGQVHLRHSLVSRSVKFTCTLVRFAIGQVHLQLVRFAVRCYSTLCQRTLQNATQQQVSRPFTHFGLSTTPKSN